MKKLKLNIKKISKFIGIILFLAMLILIYIVSPRITAVIQDMAKYIYEVDSNYITRVVELILSVSLVLSIVAKKESTKKSK